MGGRNIFIQVSSQLTALIQRFRAQSVHLHILTVTFLYSQSMYESKCRFSGAFVLVGLCSPWRLATAAAAWMNVCVCVCVLKPLGKTELACPADTPADEQLTLHCTHNLTGQSAAWGSLWRLTQQNTTSLSLLPPISVPLDINVNMPMSCCLSLRFMKMSAVSDEAQESRY